MKKLAIFLPELAEGGAERVMLNLAPAFMAVGYDVTFLLPRFKGSNMKLIPAGAKAVSLRSRSTIGCLFPLIRYLRRQRPAVLLSNLGHNNIVAIWAVKLSRVRTRVIVTQHNTLSQECRFRKSWRYKILPLLSYLFLPMADAIIAVSQGAAADLAAVCGIAREYVSVIPNPVVTGNFESRMKETVSHPWLDGKIPVILGIGRLAAQKDFKTLLSAFAIASRQRELRLVILGEGPQRAALLKQAAAEGIAEKIDLPGFQPNPLPFIRQAKLLVTSSLYEGFGNVIAEALACGTNVVSTDCPHGPAEILENGAYGRLVPVGDAEAMAEAMCDALEHPMDAEKLRKRGNGYSAMRAAGSYLRCF